MLQAVESSKIRNHAGCLGQPVDSKTRGHVFIFAIGGGENVVSGFSDPFCSQQFIFYVFNKVVHFLSLKGMDYKGSMH